jgi:hypothetical protein
MGDAACQHSQAFHLESGERFLLSALQFGDVFDYGKAVEGLAFLIADKGMQSG